MWGRLDYLTQLYLLFVGTICPCVIDVCLCVMDVTLSGKLALPLLVSLSLSFWTSCLAGLLLTTHLALAFALPIPIQHRCRRSSSCYPERRLAGSRGCNERQTRFMTRLRPRAAPTCVPEEEEEEEEEQEEEEEEQEEE